VEQAALCVFPKQKKLRIVWHLTRRESSQVMEYPHKAEAVADQIARGVLQELRSLVPTMRVPAAVFEDEKRAERHW
jgi:hypothetical protein